MEQEIDETRRFFLITQFLTLLLAILITGLMQLSSEQAIYLFYFIPTIIIWMGFQYYLFKNSNDQGIGAIIFCNIALFILSCPLFFGLYFGIFHPTQSISFDKVSNCQIIGQMSLNLHGNENYSILYVDYEQDGQKHLGYSCLSNNNKAGINNKIMPYLFYEKGDYYNCGPTKQGKSYDLKKRILMKGREKRLLKSGGGSCKQIYGFSNVKLASWMCLPRKVDNEVLLEPHKSCYVRFYSNYNDSQNNSIQRENLRQSSEFMMVSFESSIYYPKIDFITMIIFTYYPFLSSLCLPMMFLARYLLSLCQPNKVKVISVKENIDYLQQSVSKDDIKFGQSFDQQSQSQSQIQVADKYTPNNYPGIQMVSVELPKISTVNQSQSIQHSKTYY